MLTPVDLLSQEDLVLSSDEMRRLEVLSAGIAEALINAMEAKSPYLRGHSHRVAATAAAIAEQMGLDDAVVEQIRLAGKLHDVGKIGIREAILDKPASLTPEEFAHVREHVRIGLDILAPLTHLGPVLQYVADHHERLDGSGYPRGLKGNAISLGGRIIGAADQFDALTSPRAYRNAMDPGESLAYLQGLGPKAVCPTVLPALSRVVKSGQVLVFLNDG